MMAMMIWRIVLYTATVLGAAAVFGGAQAKNGFDLTAAAIPAAEILSGGPPRDGIPAIDEPVFTAAAAADFMHDDDGVLGVVVDGVARAYPIKILNWHEIVNDDINGMPFVVTFCPLCGSGVVFDAQIDGRRLQFGVSGLLYNSDVLLYDRQTDSLWSQLLRRAVSGEYVDTALRTLPVQHTTWRHWRQQHAATQILTTETGERRDYDSSPYDGYAESAALFFPVKPLAPQQFHPKEWVLGVQSGGDTKVYPFSELQKNGAAQVQDTVGGHNIIIHWHEQEWAAHAEWQTGDGNATRAFWFAWFAFHPETRIFVAQ